MDVDVGEEVVYVADYDGGLLLLHFTPTSRVNLPLVRR
jgi:hypothetical protein